MRRFWAAVATAVVLVRFFAGLHSSDAQPAAPSIGGQATGALTIIGPPPTCTFDVYFSPYEDIEDVIHQELSNSRGPIFFSLYGISNHALADDLIRIVKGGEDKKQAAGRSDLHALLIKAGVDLVVKPVGVLEHNKMLVIEDTQTVVIGSWNWSRTAQRQDNSEVVFHHCPEVVRKAKDAVLRIIQRDEP